MKFFEQYTQYMQRECARDLPALNFHSFSEILERCRYAFDFNTKYKQYFGGTSGRYKCTACEGRFFTPLLKEMTAVIDCFKDRAQELLDTHSATGLWKCFLFLKCMFRNDNTCMIQKCQDLVTYAMINAEAVRKILNKYDKIHCCSISSKQSQAFKSSAQRMHLNIQQSPQLYDLIAAHINLIEESEKRGDGAVLFKSSSLQIMDEKLALRCEVDSLKFEIDLKCPICLDTVFDAVGLTCGHIYCYTCACRAASVNRMQGLKAAAPGEKCPLCRGTAVYQGAVRLQELNCLLSRRCRDYWEERLESERVDRLQQFREHRQ